MDNEKQKPKKKKKSSIPVYAVGLVWISYALDGKLTNFGGVAACAVLSGVVYLVLVVAIRAISKDDLALMPKGDKLARLLRL